MQPVDSARFARALDRQLERVVQILDEARTRCTFFVLAKTAERSPHWIKRLSAAGHEIASHGYGHERLSTLTPHLFRDDLRRSLDVLAALTGARPRGYRAPYLSLGRREVSWAYDVMLEEGIAWSSSVLPFAARGGIGDHALGAVRVARPSGSLVEVPVSVVELAGRRIPIAGGGFWRATPAPLIDAGLRRLAHEGRAAVVYLHPHEFDDEPLRSHRGRRRNAYVNLGRASIADKLRRALRAFSFGPMGELVAQSVGR